MSDAFLHDKRELITTPDRYHTKIASGGQLDDNLYSIHRAKGINKCKALIHRRITGITGVSGLIFVIYYLITDSGTNFIGANANVKDTSVNFRL